MLLQYGGGGHETAGTCQVPIADWERILEEVIATLKADHQATCNAPELAARP
jgi:nanoRNase/pAp phosphatase (c-di-AMP/oligoRNAs hydrolase)